MNRISLLADWVFVFAIFLTIGFYAGNTYFRCQKLDKDVKILKIQIQTLINKNRFGQVPFTATPLIKIKDNNESK